MENIFKNNLFKFLLAFAFTFCLAEASLFVLCSIANIPAWIEKASVIFSAITTAIIFVPILFIKMDYYKWPWELKWQEWKLIFWELKQPRR